MSTPRVPTYADRLQAAQTTLVLDIERAYIQHKNLCAKGIKRTLVDGKRDAEFVAACKDYLVAFGDNAREGRG